MSPLAIKEELVYPGCILQLISATFFMEESPGEVKVSTGMAKPIKL